MAGAGNDFIIIDAPRKGFPLKKFTQKVCDRTNGIGADGVIVLGSSKKEDYKMRIINADGSEAEMCGNGARCFASYVNQKKNLNGTLFSIETLAGTILGSAQGETAIVRLSDPNSYRPNISLKVKGKTIKVSYIDTGVPHAVAFVRRLDKCDVRTSGNQIRFHKAFSPRGANVNFVEPINKKLVAARTYERGVEDETKACGTGSVAAALISYMTANQNQQNKEKARMNVKTTGGEILKVTFDIREGQPNNVWLEGSAKFIASGEYYL